MEIRDFAETILFGKNIDDKLVGVKGGWSDNTPLCNFSLPENPGRSEKYTPVFRRQGKFDFPKVSEFASESGRAKALHYFANHELEAIELMALALLKFSDAPKIFRLALAGIITEEQKHLRLYMERMQDLGIEFGTYPLSGFFWSALSKADTLKKFTAAMNLTLEQANLDHCLFFQKVFEKVGDEKSANIMKEVLADEIGHVRHGVNWFQRWHTEGSQWKNYLENLPQEINPARARGKLFSSEIRKEVGFDIDFIKNLEVYSHSRGRVPDLYYFYPFVEYELALGPHGINIPRKMYSLKTDLDILPVYLAKNDDMVLVEKAPRTEFLQQLKDAGFSGPQFVEKEELENSGRRLRSFQPWGWCYHTRKLQKEISSAVPVTVKSEQEISYFNELYAKTLSLEILKNNPDLCDGEIIGQVACNEDEANKSISEIQSRGYNVVIKAVLGSSGQNQIQIKSDSAIEDQQKSWLRRLLKEQGKVIVEPWLDRAFDFSVQMKVNPDGTSKLLGHARFICDETGKYRGAWLGGFETNLKKEEIIFVRKNNLLNEITQKTMKVVADTLHKKNYSGTAGVDCFVYRDKFGDLKIKPIVEVNVRNNMGEITVNFSKHMVSRRVGIWQIVGQHELKTFGVSSFSELEKKLKEKHPLRMRESLIDSGVLFTTDPSRAQGYTSFMLVGNSLSEISQLSSNS